MLLCGEPGCGKTHLSIAVANRLMPKGTPVLYFQHKDGVDELLDLIAQGGRTYPKIKEMKQVELLIWDDLFKSAKTDPKGYGVELAIDVLYYRYAEGLPTIINTEYLPGDLVKLDKGMGSRILERSEGHMVAVQGIENNYRLSK